MADGMLALTWNNHSTTFFKTLSTVRIKERYTDVTLSCEGKFYQLHKLVLSTCSDYFEKIFEQTPCKHPVIVLRDVSCDELEALLNYMYLGSVSVAQNDLSRLIKVAELFRIKGLAVPDEAPKNSDSDSLSNKRIDSDSHSNRRIDSDSHSNRRNDRNSNQRTSLQPELSRTRPCASDSPDVPLPKRVRTSESFRSSAEQISPSANSVSHAKDLSSIDNRGQSQPGISDSTGIGTDISGTSGIEAPPFNFRIKEEVIHDIRDSDSEDPNSRGAFDALHDPDSSGTFEPPLQDDSQGATGFIPKSEPEDIPSDDQSGLDQEHFKDDALSIPGPSDAQGWYSEGDTSAGPPAAKGSINDESQEMLPLLVSQQQQQQQQMVVPQTFSNKGRPMGRNVRLFQCQCCPYSTKNRAHLQHHILIHTGEKPYTCSFCPAAFTFKGSMKRHERTHTGERPFRCPMCPYRASQKSSLMNHVQKHLEIQQGYNEALTKHF